jgi:hypothetical protein
MKPTTKLKRIKDQIDEMLSNGDFGEHVGTGPCCFCRARDISKTIEDMIELLTTTNKGE